MLYSERLSAPWWWHPAGLALAVALGYEVGVTFYVVLASVATLVAVSQVGPLLLGRHRVGVDDGALLVDRERVPLSALGPPVLRTGDVLRRRLGPAADPAAKVRVCWWIHTAVEFPALDPASGVPYWLVSTRRPVELAQAVEQARSQAAGTARV